MMNEWRETDIGKVPNNWQIGTLGDICELLTDGAHSSPKPIFSDFLMASVKDMRYNKFDFSECKRVSKEDFDFLEKNNCSPKYGDILLSKDGANCLDIIFVYKQAEKIVLLSSIAIARLKPGFDPDFYRYFLLAPNTQFLMRNNFVSGSAIPRVILKDFRRVPVPITSYSEQKAIASILSSLDDKIDLLHRQNATLEAMAETLFRQWFVEEAKEEWEDGVLSDIIEFNYGKTLRDGERSGNGFPVYGSSGIVGYHKDFLVPGPGIITGRKGTLGIINYSFQNFFPIDTTFFITSKRNSKGLFFEYFLLKTLNLSEMNSDSAVPGLNRNLAHGIQISIPPVKLVNQFNHNIAPMFSKVRFNQNQITILTTLRDTLLPKLMSGEVKIN